MNSENREELEQKSREPRSWKNCTLEDLVTYKEKHYSGLNREQIKKRDRGFHSVVITRGYSVEVFGPRLPKYWKNFAFEDCQQYYRHHHSGKTVGELQNTERGFHNHLKRNGWLHRIVQVGRKPSRYYKELKNIHLDIEGIINEIGVFPSYLQITERNQGLARAMQRYHGGYRAVKIKLGYAKEELEVIREIISRSF